MNLRNKGGLISLITGFPIGLITIILVILFLGGGGMGIFAWEGLYGYPILGMLIVFPFMLWISGRVMVNDILSKRSIIITTWKYSFLVNSVIWFVFLFIYLLLNHKVPAVIIMAIPIFILAFISLIGTPFSIGLIIYKLIKNRVVA